MARITADRILETSTTTGTGALTLAGAVTGYRAFSAVCTSPSDTCYYYIEGVDASGIPTGEWETGLGTYSAANTLTRTTPSAGSAATPVSFSAGTKRVAIALVAENASFSGALVYKTADETTANYSAGVMIPWTNESYDTGSYHDSVTNNSRITINVAGKYIFKCGLNVASLVGSDFIRILLCKGGSVANILGGFCSVVEISASPSIYLSATSAAIDCAAADYFEVWLDTESDTSITVSTLGSWFSVERVE